MRSSASARFAPLAIVVLVLASAPVGAQIILPNQEGLVAGMLGSGEQLPGGCAFADGQIDHDVVRATYRCSYGDVRIRVSHPSGPGAPAIVTRQFAVTVLNGSPRDDLLAALEARIRSRESEFGWSSRNAPTDGRTASWLSALLLVALAAASAIGAPRAAAARRPIDRLAAIEALVVAAVVVLGLYGSAEPPAHGDTAVDVALARDCVDSAGASCLGHAASAIGLAQGQAFTYLLGVWLYLGFSMHALSLVAAGLLGAATGLLHYVVARRFGGVAWIVSACMSALAVAMTGFPTIWNPSWFVLPLTIAFVATLALARGSGMWSAFVAGVAFALTSESHVLLGTFVAVAALVVAVTARRPVTAVGTVVASFVLTEIAISPVSVTLNALILRRWMGEHAASMAVLVLLCCASLPMLLRVRRASRDDPAAREAVVVFVWIIAGVLALGLVLPWAVSRPPQIRYYGAAFPAIGYAAGWLLRVVTPRARGAGLRVVAAGIFAATVWIRSASGAHVLPGWVMDDGLAIATSAGLAGTSALDVQLMVRTIPAGAVELSAAAFVGTADPPSFPTRIVRAVLARSDVQAPAGWNRIRHPHGEILTSDLDAWTRPEEAEICPDPPNGDPCLTLTREDFLAVGRSAGGFLHRVFGLRIARSATRIAEWTTHGAHALLWRLPLRASGPDESREILFPAAIGERIVTVEGTRWRARSDRHAVVERPAPGTVASITVRTPIVSYFEAGIPPLPFELREAELGIVSEPGGR